MTFAVSVTRAVRTSASHGHAAGSLNVLKSFLSSAKLR